MEIRSAEPKDEKNISELFYKLYPNFKAPKDLLALNTITSRFISLVVEENNKIEGFILGTFIAYGPCKYGYIEELYVEESARKKGIGTKLINNILEEYKKLDTWAIYVMTKSEDPIAQSFYTKLGFTKSKGLWLYKEWYYFLINNCT